MPKTKPNTKPDTPERSKMTKAGRKSGGVKGASRRREQLPPKWIEGSSGYKPYVTPLHLPALPSPFAVLEGLTTHAPVPTPVVQAPEPTRVIVADVKIGDTIARQGTVTDIRVSSGGAIVLSLDSGRTATRSPAEKVVVLR